jgi:hypothetical protein
LFNPIEKDRIKENSSNFVSFSSKEEKKQFDKVLFISQSSDVNKTTESFCIPLKISANFISIKGEQGNDLRGFKKKSTSLFLKIFLF